MKKLLALVLALVMSMSLVTISNAAFSDAKDIEHTEAVEVMNALGVIAGLPDGSFGPEGNVTRAQMAKMITVIMLGDVDPAAFVGTTTDLTDVSGHWAEGYIKYCYSQGVIAGTGAGKFEPEANVTAVQAAKMLLVAIGYNADIQGYVGADWAINIIRDAQLSKLFDELSVTATQVLTRDDAAQMIYNAINAKMIEKTPSINITNGQVTYSYQPGNKTLLSETFGAKKEYGYVTDATWDSTKKQFKYDVADDAFGMSADADDPYTGAPAIYSEDDFSGLFGQKVAIVYKDAKNVYGIYSAAAVLAEDVIGNVTAPTAAAEKVKIDGTEYKLDAAAGSTNVYEFLDNTAVGQLDDVAYYTENHPTYGCNAFNKAFTGKLIDNDDDGKGDLVVVYPFNVAKVSYVGKSTITLDTKYGAPSSLKVDDITVYDGIAKDDYVVVTANLKSDYTLEKLEKVTEKVTKIKSYSSSNATKLVAGETYKIADTSKDAVTSANIGKDLTAVAYNGYLFYTDASSKAGIDKFAMLVKAEATATGLNKHPRAILLMSDGTEKTVDLSDSNTFTTAGNMVKFSVTDDLYTLVLATDAVVSDVDFDGYAGEKDYDKSTGKADTYLLSDDAVVFCKDSKGNWIVSTGAEVKKGDNHLYQAFYKTNKSTGYSTIEICTMATTVTVTNSNYAVVFSGISTVENADSEKVAEFDIWTVDGKKTVTTTNLYSSLSLSKGAVITYTDKGDDVITVDSTVSTVESAVVAYNPNTNSDGENDIAFAGGTVVSGVIAKDTVVNAITDEDTVVLYVDVDSNGDYTGVEGGEIRLATESDSTGNNFYTNVKYEVSGASPKVVKVLVVEIDNDFQNVM